MENNTKEMVDVFYSPRMIEAMNSYQFEKVESKEENGMYSSVKDSTDKKMLKASINGLMFAMSIGKVEKIEHYINKIQDIVLDDYVLFNEVMKSAVVVAFKNVNPKVAEHLVLNYLVDVTSIVEELSPYSYKDAGLSKIISDFGNDKLEQFYDDCKRGRFELVDEAIKEGININANNSKALRTAISSSNVDVAIALLNAGANPEVGNLFEKALNIAAMHGEEKLIEAFMEKLSTKSKNEGLLVAVRNQDIKSIERLLVSGASATYENNVAVAMAVDFAPVEIVKTLVSFGADIYANNCAAIDKALHLKRDDVLSEVMSDKFMGIREINANRINSYIAGKLHKGDFEDVAKLMENGLSSKIVFDNHENADRIIFNREVTMAYQERRNQGIKAVPLKQIENRDWETNKVHSLTTARRGKDLKFGRAAM